MQHGSPPSSNPCPGDRLLDEAWQVYQWLRDDGLPPSRPTYSRLISLCAYSPEQRGRDALAMHQAMVEEGVDLDAFMVLHLVTALGGAPPGGWAGLIC
jgi:hypothetical protein